MAIDVGLKPPAVIEGRIIHYVPRPEMDGNVTRHVPGMIVKVWDASRGYINAIIFPDGSNDQFRDQDMRWATLPLWRTSISYDEKCAPGTWHFPEHV